MGETHHEVYSDEDSAPHSDQFPIVVRPQSHQTDSIWRPPTKKYKKTWAPMDDPHGLFDEPPQPRTHGGDFDLFGKLRKVPLRLNRLKNTYSSTVKPDELNQDYLITEAPVATAVRTQSTVMKNFEQPYLTAFPDVEIAPANF